MECARQQSQFSHEAHTVSNPTDNQMQEQAINDENNDLSNKGNSLEDGPSGFIEITENSESFVENNPQRRQESEHKNANIHHIIQCFTKKQKSVEDVIELDDDEVRIQKVFKPSLPKARPKVTTADSFQKNEPAKKIQSHEEEIDLLGNMEITMQDCDLKQLEEYKISVPEPQVFLGVIDAISRLMPKFSLEHTLCILDTYLQNAEKKALSNSNTPPTITINQLQKPPQTGINLFPSIQGIQSNNFVKRHRVRRHFANNLGFSDPKMTLSFREQLQRKIAYVFIQKGYGLGLTRQALKQDIQNNLYNSLLTSVIRSSLRKLVDILNNNLKLHVEPFDSRDEINLRSPMANCRKWMEARDQTTLYKIINTLYTLNGPQQIFPQEVGSLFYRICRYIDKRPPSSVLNLVNMDPSQASKIPITTHAPQKPPLNNFSSQFKQSEPTKPDYDRNSMNSQSGSAHSRPLDPNAQSEREYQKEMVYWFMRVGSIEKICQTLTIKYPRRSTTPQAIYQTIERIIKLGLKRLANSYIHFRNKGTSLPALTLNEAIVGHMMRDRGNSQFRILLLKHMNECSSSMNESKLTNIVNFINQYIQQQGIGRSNPKPGESSPHQNQAQ